MSLVLTAQNYVKTANITASTENAQFPVSNLKKDLRTKVYRSTSNSDNIVFDLGSIEDIDFIGCVDNWKDGFGIATLKVEANGTDVWTSPAYSTTITIDTTFGVALKKLANAESYRFWRFVVTSTLGYCELSNVVIGKSSEITTNGIQLGWSYRNRDLKNLSRTRYGQRYIDDINQVKQVDRARFEVMNRDEIDKIFEVYDNARTVNPVWVTVSSDCTLYNDDDRINGIYYMDREPVISNRSAGFYELTLSLEECK